MEIFAFLVFTTVIVTLILLLSVTNTVTDGAVDRLFERANKAVSPKHRKQQKALKEKQRTTTKEDVAYYAGKEFFASNDYIYDDIEIEQSSLYTWKLTQGERQYNIPLIMEYVMKQYPSAWIQEELELYGVTIDPVAEPSYEQQFWQGVYDFFVENYNPVEVYSSHDAQKKSLQWVDAYQKTIEELI